MENFSDILYIGNTDFIGLTASGYDLAESSCDEEILNLINKIEYDEGSWLRVFEENFMRAATIWVIYHDNKVKAETDAKLDESYGFIYVPIILEEFFLNWNGLNNFSEFVKGCLRPVTQERMGKYD